LGAATGAGAGVAGLVSAALTTCAAGAGAGAE